MNMDISIIYPNFNRLKVLTRWAGLLAVLQSLTWLGLSIVGVVYYLNDVVAYEDENYGTIINIILYTLYFCGDVNTLTNTEFPILNDVQTTLNPNQINIWIWVYLVSSVFWLISSLSLVMQIQKATLRGINTLLYIWIFITLYISGMDLALSVIFGLDFDQFNQKSYSCEFYNENNEKTIIKNGVVLMAAKISSITMMIMAAKGFILWFINVGCMSYFLHETFVISEAIAADKTSCFMSDTHSMTNRAPIKAYDTKNNFAFSSRQQRDNSIKLNTAPIERASRMSNAVLEDRNISGNYNRGFSSYEQYPKNENNDISFPEPDYTPPMPRSNRFVKPPLRPVGSESFKNKRYF